MKFEDICKDGICDVCGNKAKIAVLASSMGSCSFAYCKDCLGKEPYSAIIGCYSSLGQDDVDWFYNKNKKVMKEFYHKAYDEFSADCKNASKEHEMLILRIDFPFRASFERRFDYEFI